MTSPVLPSAPTPRCARAGRSIAFIWASLGLLIGLWQTYESLTMPRLPGIPFPLMGIVVLALFGLIPLLLAFLARTRPRVSGVVFLLYSLGAVVVWWPGSVHADYGFLLIAFGLIILPPLAAGILLLVGSRKPSLAAPPLHSPS